MSEPINTEFQDYKGNVHHFYTDTDAVLTEDGQKLTDVLEAKVDTIEGKGLSTNDYSKEDKEILYNIALASSKFDNLDRLDVNVSSRASQTSVDNMETAVDAVNTAVNAVNTAINSISSKADTANTDINKTNTQIGTSSDAATATTLFGRIRQIYEYLTSNLSVTRTAKIDYLDVSVNSRASQTSVNDVKTVADTVNTNVSSIGTKIDTTNTRIGTSSDSASNSGTSLFALVKYIVSMFTGTWTTAKAGYLDASVSTVNTNVTTTNTRIGTSSDTASSSGTTLFSFIKYITGMFTGTWTATKAGYLDASVSSVNTNVDTANSRIGTSSDTANNSGTTLFSLIKYLIPALSSIDSNVDSAGSALDSVYSKVDSINSNVNSANLTLGTINSRTDTTISSRAAQSTAEAIMAKTDLIGTSSAIGSVIKSIQSGYYSFGSATTNPTITFSAVNVAKSFIIMQSGTNLPFLLTSSTTLVATGSYSGTGTWQVIEFY